MNGSIDRKRGNMSYLASIPVQVVTMKDLRARCCMAQGSTREIPQAWLTLIQDSGMLPGETQVRIGSDFAQLIEQGS